MMVTPKQPIQRSASRRAVAHFSRAAAGRHYNCFGAIRKIGPSLLETLEAGLLHGAWIDPGDAQ